VENSSRLLRTNETGIDIARRLERFLNGGFGDFVEDQAMDGHLRFEEFDEVPTDGLAFPVLVRCEVEGIGVLQMVLEELDLFALARRDDIDRREIMVDVDAEIGPGLSFILGWNLGGSLRQIADVSDTSLNGVPSAQVLADGAGFGR